MSSGLVELLVFVVMAAFVIAVLLYAAWYFIDTRRHAKWREHEDEMMEEITEHRIRRNFPQGG